MKVSEIHSFIILGAGPRAKRSLDFLCCCHLDHLVQAFCVLQKKLLHQTIHEKPFLLWNEATAKNIPFLLAVEKKELPVANYLLTSSGSRYYTDLTRLLSAQFGFDATWLSRQYCEFIHENYMDDYYEKAEDFLNKFWGADSAFFRMFSSLDLTDVVELACGHGRHVEQYIDRAGSVTLVDISEKNLSFCKARFSERQNIHYYKNNGYDLSALNDDSYSALFSYDSMVHFEMFDIYCYLKETRRILKKGGCALFHHSNLTIDPKQSFYTPLNKGSRTYMSKDLFAHIAYQAGLNVIEQQVIDWSMPEMDCLTLVKKE